MENGRDLLPGFFLRSWRSKEEEESGAVVDSAGQWSPSSLFSSRSISANISHHPRWRLDFRYELLPLPMHSPMMMLKEFCAGKQARLMTSSRKKRVFSPTFVMQCFPSDARKCHFIIPQLQVHLLKDFTDSRANEDKMFMHRILFLQIRIYPSSGTNFLPSCSSNNRVESMENVSKLLED